MRFLLLAVVACGLTLTAASAETSKSSKDSAPGQKQTTPGTAKDFAPGQKQTTPGTAKGSAPGQQDKNAPKKK